MACAKMVASIIVDSRSYNPQILVFYDFPARTNNNFLSLPTLDGFDKTMGFGQALYGSGI